MARKEKIGVVVSKKTKKTIIVAIQTRYRDLKYGKILIKTKRYMAHNEEDNCSFGDLVLIEESAPFSRNKKWNLKKIIKFHKLK